MKLKTRAKTKEDADKMSTKVTNLLIILLESLPKAFRRRRVKITIDQNEIDLTYFFERIPPELFEFKSFVIDGYEDYYGQISDDLVTENLSAENFLNIMKSAEEVAFFNLYIPKPSRKKRTSQKEYSQRLIQSNGCIIRKLTLDNCTIWLPHSIEPKLKLKNLTFIGYLPGSNFVDNWIEISKLEELDDKDAHFTPTDLL